MCFLFQMMKLKASMEGDIQQAHARANKMEGSLVESKHELLKVQEMLEMASKDLEKKVCAYL